MNELTLAVVGIAYPNRDGSSRLFEILLCTPGEPITFRPEPRNRHDPHAVAVLSARGHQIGYLTAERAPWIGRRLATESAAAVFQGRDEAVAYVRVAFGDRRPTLPTTGGPSSRSRAEDVGPDDQFFPDPEGPDWGA